MSNEPMPGCAICGVKLARRSRKYCSIECRTKAAHVRAAEKVADGTRVCSKCSERKPLSDYDKHTQTANGYRPDCKTCRQNRLNSSTGHKDRARRDSLRRNYNISLEEYNQLLEAQGGGCAICGKRPEQQKTNLAVDHDHKTGTVRGILCTSCNLRLVGKFRDGALFRSAADYLDAPPFRECFGFDVVVPKQPPRRRRRTTRKGRK